jgi:fructose-bisphosphate aldolase class I
LDVNSEILAQYAAVCQANVIVPIVEPEILMDGDHTIERASQVCLRVLSALFSRLQAHSVRLEAALLKTNMVLPGVEAGMAAAAEVASCTLRCLSATVPPALAGVVFLSGGLSEALATEYLAHINSPQVDIPRPWRLSFSYARALQHSALLAWGGHEEKVEEASQILVRLASANSLASRGIASESEPSTATLHVKNYVY